MPGRAGRDWCRCAQIPPHKLTSLSRSASPLSLTRNEWGQRWSHPHSIHQPQVGTSTREKHQSRGHRREGRTVQGVESGVIRIGVSGDSDSGPKAEAILCGAEDSRHGRVAEESSGGGGGGGGSSGIVVVVVSAGTWHSIIIMESATTATQREAPCRCRRCALLLLAFLCLGLPCLALSLSRPFRWPHGSHTR